MKRNAILVTGGAGSIGGNLVRLLSGRNNTVVVLDDLSAGQASKCPRQAGVIFYKGSILDDKLTEKIFFRSGYRISRVFHLAAHFANQNSVEHPASDLMTNALGTLKLLELSRKACVDKFIYSSSSCVYGERKNDLKEDLRFKPETPYAISKLCGEEYVNFYHRFYKIPVVILRYFNAFGPGDSPGQYRNVIPNFMYKAIKGEPLVITGTGKETRDFTYMDDIVRGTVLASQAGRAVGHAFNIGTGTETSIRRVAELINKLSGNKSGVRYIRRRNWDNISRRVANIENSRRILKYSPKVPFEEGLERTFRWFRDVYK